MDIIIHTPHLHADENAVRDEVAHSLRHFNDRVTRIDVYVKDLNADKGGVDKRCTIEARPRGLDPVAVDGDGASVSDAVTGAAKKLERHMDKLLGKRDDHRG